VGSALAEPSGAAVGTPPSLAATADGEALAEAVVVAVADALLVAAVVLRLAAVAFPLLFVPPAFDPSSDESPFFAPPLFELFEPFGPFEPPAGIVVPGELVPGSATTSPQPREG